MFDCHMHSVFSADGKMTMDEACCAAIQKGLKGIAITDHLDFDYPGPIIYETDFEKYFSELDNVKQKYRNDFTVLKGIELGFQPHTTKMNEDVITKWNFDYIISSIHIVNRKDPFYPEFYEGIPLKAACCLYLGEIIKSIKSFPEFDVLGHIDYIRRYFPVANSDKLMKYADYTDLLDEILKLLVASEKGIEFNTGGIRYKLESVFTDLRIFERYKELGGEKVCLGSDAHATSNIADGFPEAAGLLKDLGFRYLVHYENRKEIFDKI